MNRFKLSKVSKIILFMIIVSSIVIGGFVAMSKGLIKPNKKADNPKTETIQESGNNTSGFSVTEKKNSDGNHSSTINLSLDEWIGWKSIIDANGGLKTTADSIYGKLGLDVNIYVINDATQSSNALIKGELDAAGYTINRVAFLSQKFTTSNVDVVMPYITNYSNGGDGIIANSKYTTVESLVDAKIGVPEFSEAHSLVVWFVNQSDLTSEQKNQIIQNLIYFETPDEAAKAFFAGQIDVAATWQPYLSQAQDTSDCHVLFSTASSTKLIMDGILFREDFAKENPETVQKFIDGSLQAADMYNKEFGAIREVMPMFAGESDASISEMTIDAALTDWNNNMKTLKEDAPDIFLNMCDVWESVGESVNRNMNQLFDTSYMAALTDSYQTLVSSTNVEIVKVTEDNMQTIMDTQALLSKSATVNFIVNTAKFTDTAEASGVLDDFIKVAKALDGTIIQIEGNTDPNPVSDPSDEANIMLSQQRADAVKQYFIMNGVSANRIITVGNGSSKPIVTNDTEENRAMNRRTDVSFKIIE